MRGESGVLLAKSNDSRTFSEEDSEPHGPVGLVTVMQLRGIVYKLSTRLWAKGDSRAHIFVTLYNRSEYNQDSALEHDVNFFLLSRTLVFGS